MKEGQEELLPKLPEDLEDLQEGIKQRTVKTELEAEIIDFRVDLNRLLVEFKELLKIVKRVDEKERTEGHQFQIDELDEKDRNKFFGIRFKS